MLTKDEAKRFLKARSSFIASCYTKLNDMQTQAVLATEGPLLLLAGAGSGKTTVLVNRIANIIRFGAGADSDVIPEYISSDDVAFLEDQVSGKADDPDRAEQLARLNPAAPWQVIAITFTNKAANEMKARLETMLGGDASGIWASTFHSACCRILRKDADRIGYGSDFAIYDTSDTERLMKDIMKELNLDEKNFPPKSVLSAISKAKDEGKTPEDYVSFAEGSGDYRLTRIARCYVMYQTRLVKSNAMDFDDILMNTVHLFDSCPDVLEFYQRKFKYVLIDEYQDTNNLQYRFASMLAGGYKNFCVVGDDDQSIYRFRGATVENILSFENQYPGCRVIKLEQNYRSSANILKAANAVISNNKNRKGKNLWCAGPEGDKINVIIAEDENEEAQRIASKMIALKSEGFKWSDFAVLYRMNAQSNRIEYAFKRNGIPYKVVGGMRFFDRAEVKDMLSYLSVIHNPGDMLRLLRIVNTPSRGIGDKSLEKARSLSAALALPLIDIMRDAWKYPELRSAAPKMMQFAELIDELSELSKRVTPSELYDEVIEKSGYVQALMKKETAENESRIQNVKELKTSIVSYENQALEPTLEGFLEEIALYTDLDNYDGEEDSAVMMTIHSAKGLEFGAVFIAGAEEGIFPSFRSTSDEDELQEERRLCYVAITRAKQKLFVTCARHRMLFGHTTANRPSRFLNEIPEECVVGLRENAKPKVEYSFSSDSGSSYSRPSQSSFAAKRPAPARNRFTAPAAPKKTSNAAASFAKGDSIEHKAFGRGLVLSATPVGNDCLLEVAFDSVGTKRFMRNTAAQFMKKV